MRSEASPEPRRAAVRRGEWTVALLMALLASCFGIDQTWRMRGGSARARRGDCAYVVGGGKGRGETYGPGMRRRERRSGARVRLHCSEGSSPVAFFGEGFMP